jgi:hypothetical protein
MAHAIMTQAARTPAELRRFGFVMAGAFAVVAGLLYWKDSPAWPYVATLAAAFALAGLAFPRALGGVERAWMALAERMSVVSTVVLLTLAFLLVATPLGLLMRLTGRDRLRRKGRAESYWEPVDPGPARRPNRPF